MWDVAPMTEANLNSRQGWTFSSNWQTLALTKGDKDDEELASSKNDLFKGGVYIMNLFV